MTSFCTTLRSLQNQHAAKERKLWDWEPSFI